jgi:carbon storage regulator
LLRGIAGCREAGYSIHKFITRGEAWRFTMLVLSRKQSQRIKLGDSIVITVVRVAGDKVRLGIDAPRDMLVLRDELEPHGAADGGVEVVSGALSKSA